MRRPPVLAAAAVAAASLLAGCSGSASAPAPEAAAGPATATPSTGALPEGADPVLGPAAAELTTPLVLTAPAHFGPCPEAGDVLSAAVGTRMAYWQGKLPGGPSGCQWADVDTVTAQTLTGQRYSVGIGFYAGDPATGLSGAISSGAPACVTTPQPLGVPMTASSRCTTDDGSPEDGDTTWTYLLPDAGGTGLWLLSATVGDAYPGDAEQLAGAGLAAIAQVADTAWGSR